MRSLNGAFVALAQLVVQFEFTKAEVEEVIRHTSVKDQIDALNSLLQRKHPVAEQSHYNLNQFTTAAGMALVEHHASQLRQLPEKTE